MRWLVKLYPKGWRARYGEEFAEILASQRPSLGLVVDVVAGALDARFKPQRVTRTSQGEQTMTIDLMKRCAAGGPQLSAREQRTAGGLMILGALVVAVAYVLLSRRLGASSPPVEAIGYTAFPAMLLVYLQVAYLRNRPLLTQTVLVGGGLAAVYLMTWGACVLSARL